MSAIEVKSLSKSYPAAERPVPGSWLGGRRSAERVLALRQISLTVEPGEIVGLVGPNGSGKSTLLRVLATLDLPDSGEVSVCGLDVVEHAAAVRRKIGAVLPLDAGFEPRATLRENLKFFAALTGRYIGPPDIYYALDGVGLAERADDTYASLGSGQRRRMSLARAFLADPRVLLLDEPTRSVDAEFAGRIADLIRQTAHSSGAAVLLVSHNPEEIRNLCDRSLLLDQGRLLHATPPRKPAVAVDTAVGR